MLRRSCSTRGTRVGGRALVGSVFLELPETDQAHSLQSLELFYFLRWAHTCPLWLVKFCFLVLPLRAQREEFGKCVLLEMRCHLWLRFMWAERCVWNLPGSAHCPVRSPRLWLVGTSWTSGQTWHLAPRRGLTLLQELHRSEGLFWARD